MHQHQCCGGRKQCRLEDLAGVNDCSAEAADADGLDTQNSMLCVKMDGGEDLFGFLLQVREEVGDSC